MKIRLWVFLLGCDHCPLDNDHCILYGIRSQTETSLLSLPDPSNNLFTSLFFDKVLFHEDGSVKGIATNDVGIAKDGSPKVLQHHR